MTTTVDDGTGARWRRAADHFDIASDLSSAERVSYLARLEAENSPLAADVGVLLAAEGELGEFLERPAIEEVAAASSDEDTWIGRRLGPYEVQELLGRGGMGEVYRAVDQRLDRQVAIKVLTGGQFEERSRQRFEREARAIAALDHSSLCTLHDVGRTDEDELYLVMTYYPGQTLSERLSAGPLPPAEAAAIVLAIADGLAVAHQAGIVHRDIKPSNVLLTERGEVKVLDFGIASHGDLAASGAAEALTRTGETPGTPAYMAPEQLRGEPSGPTSDVWALGVLLCELLAGERPRDLSRQTPLAGLPAEAESWLQARGLLETVHRAIDANPDRRWPDAGAFAEALRQGASAPGPAAPSVQPSRHRLRAALWIGAILVGAVLTWLAVRPMGPSRQEGISLLPAVVESAQSPLELTVTPFVNATGDAGLDRSAAGVTRLLRDALSASRHLRVISELAAASSVLSGETGNPSEIVVEGEILAKPPGYLWTARVLERSSGQQLAATSGEAPSIAGLYAVVDDMARMVRRALELPTDEAVDIFAADFAAGHPQAYEHYLEGLQHLKAYGYQPAEQAFRSALEVADDFTMARYRLAQVLASQGETRRALEHFHRALAESPSLDDREALYVRGSTLMIEHRDSEAAEVFAELLLRYPYEGDAMHLRALTLYASQQREEANEMLVTLTDLEPGRAVAWSLRGMIELALGRQQAAVESIERYLTLEPGSANGHHLLGDAYRAQGELDWAAEAYQRALEVDPAFHFATVQLAVTEALRGNELRATALLEGVVDDPQLELRPRLDATFELVSILRGAGRMREALRRLEVAEPLLVEEQVRHASSLVERAYCHLDLGEIKLARQLASQATIEPPGRPYRYLVARAVAELADDDLSAFDASLAELLAAQVSAAGTDATIDKTAAYLRGRRLLAESRAEDAVLALRRAVASNGYAYAAYRMYLAEALLAAGRAREAAAAARGASRITATTTANAESRLDLQLDRRRALWVLARAQAALGRPREAAETCRQLLAKWRQADADFALVHEVRAFADQLDGESEE